jgi:hypothetical protein
MGGAVGNRVVAPARPAPPEPPSDPVAPRCLPDPSLGRGQALRHPRLRRRSRPFSAIRAWRPTGWRASVWIDGLGAGAPSQPGPDPSLEREDLHRDGRTRPAGSGRTAHDRGSADPKGVIWWWSAAATPRSGPMGRIRSRRSPTRCVPTASAGCWAPWWSTRRAMTDNVERVDGRTGRCRPTPARCRRSWSNATVGEPTPPSSPISGGIGAHPDHPLPSKTVPSWHATTPRSSPEIPRTVCRQRV